MNFQFAKQGGSFAGAMAYYCHDKRQPGEARHPDSAERVAWSEIRNMLTDRTETATQIMIATAERAPILKARAGIAATGRRATQPVAAFSLAWHPSEAAGLERGEMVRVADAALKVMGLDHCQSVIIAHRDTPHPHVHVVVNRVNPETGRMEKIDPNKVRSLDRWAHDYEKARGRIYSPDRAAKYDRMDTRRARHPDKAERVRHVEARRQRPEPTDRREGPGPSKDREGSERQERPERPSREAPDRLERPGAQERGAEGSRADEGGLGARMLDKAVERPVPTPEARLDRDVEGPRARDGRSQGPEVRARGAADREEARSKPGFVEALRQRLERALGRSQGRDGGGDGREGVERASALEEGPAPALAQARTSAQDLKARSDALKDRHKVEWRDLGRDFARIKSETYDRWRGPIAELRAQLKVEAKPLWRMQFTAERQAVRDRARMERSLGGRLRLSIVATRVQRDQPAQRAGGVAGQARGFVRQVLANFLSRDLREATFVQVAERDRAALGERIRMQGDARMAEVTASRVAELARVREVYGRDKAALTERQGVERGAVRDAWREVYRGKGRDWAPREAGVWKVGVRDREAKDRRAEGPTRGAQARGATAEDRARPEHVREQGRAARPAERGRDEGRTQEQGRNGDRAQERARDGDSSRDAGQGPVPRQPAPAPAPSKFGWLDRRDQAPVRGSRFERSQEAQDRAKERGRDRDKDRGDRER